MNELAKSSLTEISRALRARDISVRELFNTIHTYAQQKNTDIFAYLELFDADENAIAIAQKKIDDEGDNAPFLTGIPIAVKDNMLIEGKTVSAASRMLENYKAPYTATVIKKLVNDNGALILGRTNMDEFAMGSSTENSAFGITKNPHDHSRVPGGSSGGSAAAVAEGAATAALGSDTGGSIRQPASLCGVVGLKPTYGAVSRHGLIAMGSSLDQIGPLTKTVSDSRVLFRAIAGRDDMDATTIPDGLYPKRSVPRNMRIGVPYHLFENGVDKDVRALFDVTLASLKKEGHSIVPITLPTSQYALPVYYVIMPAEASTNLSRLDGMRYGFSKPADTLLDDYLQTRSEGFGKEVQRRILLGTFVLSSGYIDAYYRKALRARAVITDEYEKAYEQVDCIAVPTSPSPAFHFGEKSDPVSMYVEDLFTVTANLTGMPALSVPMGTVNRDDTPLPIGIQCTAPHQAEDILFSFGEEVEKIRIQNQMRF
ncbi:MAG TPA: Asp-tRNA(Asn)/Glu-tRNA(Gln) amidotransferase subunit GatA [Candidatus Kaiserbacteria bacterium]|nr:Asp-tRNA(Asn)/Glu-tRNA(Gln) amidotransferase subunit GatA [Candidatus Kaiserbacteria bacterium]